MLPAQTDGRGCLYVHAEVPSSDDVRVFYEIPDVVAAQIKAVAPDRPFVDALVTVFEGIDAMRDQMRAAGAASASLNEAWDRIWARAEQIERDGGADAS